MRTNVAIDVDGVLANSAEVYLQMAKELGIENFRFDEYNSMYKVKTKNGRNFGEVVINEKFDEVVWRSDPFPKASVHYKMFLEDPRINVSILTARNEKHRNGTEQWLHSHGFTGYDILTHTENKEDEPVTVLIDDSPNNIRKFISRGKMGIVMNRNYNENSDLPYRVNDLEEAYNLITKFL